MTPCAADDSSGRTRVGRGGRRGRHRARGRDPPRDAGGAASAIAPCSSSCSRPTVGCWCTSEVRTRTSGPAGGTWRRRRRRCGRDWDDAARREVAEEIGVDAVPEPLDDGRLAAYEDDMVSLVGRRYRLVHDGPFAFADGEVVQARFVTRAELDALLAEVAVPPRQPAVAAAVDLTAALPRRVARAHIGWDADGRCPPRRTAMSMYGANPEQLEALGTTLSRQVPASTPSPRP